MVSGRYKKMIPKAEAPEYTAQDNDITFSIKGEMKPVHRLAFKIKRGKRYIRNLQTSDFFSIVY